MTLGAAGEEGRDWSQEEYEPGLANQSIAHQYRVTWRDLGQCPKEGKGQHTEAMAKMMSSNGAAARQHCTNHKSIQGTIPARDQFFLSQNRLWGGF